MCTLMYVEDLSALLMPAPGWILQQQLPFGNHEKTTTLNSTKKNEGIKVTHEKKRKKSILVRVSPRAADKTRL